MSSEQTQIKDNNKWIIPQGCGLDKLMSILVAVRNKNGDTEFVDDERVKTAIDLSQNLISPNITFLTSVNLLEKGNKQLKLTKIGNELTEAWIREDENISKLIQQVIKESHLIDLHDYLQTNKGIKTAKLFSFIKVQAKLSEPKDGRPFGDIPFQGIKSIIKLFEKAELLSNEQIEDFKNYKNANPDNITKKPRTPHEKKQIATTSKKTTQIIDDSHGHLSLSGIEIELTSTKNIKFAIMQLEDLLQDVDSNIESTTTESELSNVDSDDSVNS